MKQIMTSFFSKISLTKSMRRHPQSSHCNTNGPEGGMRELRDSSGSEQDAHLAMYTEVYSPSTRL